MKEAILAFVEYINSNRTDLTVEAVILKKQLLPSEKEEGYMLQIITAPSTNRLLDAFLERDSHKELISNRVYKSESDFQKAEITNLQNQTFFLEKFSISEISISCVSKLFTFTNNLCDAYHPIYSLFSSTTSLAFATDRFKTIVYSNKRLLIPPMHEMISVLQSKMSQVVAAFADVTKNSYAYNKVPYPTKYKEIFENIANLSKVFLYCQRYTLSGVLSTDYTEAEQKFINSIDAAYWPQKFCEDMLRILDGQLRNYTLSIPFDVLSNERTKFTTATKQIAKLYLQEIVVDKSLIKLNSIHL